MSDYALDSTIYFRFTTRSFSTGAPSALGSGAVACMEDNVDTPITAGCTVTGSTVTGMNLVAITATTANGFEAGKEYDVYISAGTVAGVSVVGEVLKHFCIQKESALRPTVAGRTLDVSATGEGGVDWANVGSPTTAVNLSATNIDVDQVVASVTGAVGSVTGAVGSVTGAVGSVTGNVGGNVAGSVGSVTGAVGSVTGLTASDVGAIKTKTDSLTFTVAGKVDANITHVIADPIQTNGAADTEWGGAP